MKLMHKRITIKVFGPGNKKVLKRLTINPEPSIKVENGITTILRQYFTPEGIEQVLSDAITKLDEANPGNRWRLVQVGPASFNLVWDDSLDAWLGVPSPVEQQKQV